MVKVIFRNIKNAFSGYRKVYLMLVFSQLVAIISIFFAYGIFGSYSAKMKELDIDSYSIGTYFDYGCDVASLKECLPDIMGKLEGKLEYAFISASSDVGILSMHMGYKEGKYNVPETLIKNTADTDGRYLRNSDEESANKVVVCTGGEYIIGATLEIEGQEYEIIGCERSVAARGVFSIPFTACPDHIEFWMVYFNFDKLPTSEDYNLIKNIFEEKYGEKFTIDDFDLADKDKVISYRTIIAISVAIGVMSALNTCLLYGYIISKRRKQMAIYGIIGASRLKRFIINEIEILLLSTMIVGVGFLTFRYGLQGFITALYDNTIRLYYRESYMIMMGVYMLCIFMLTSVLLLVMNRSKLTDMLRRARND